VKGPNTLGKLIVLNRILTTAVFLGVPLRAPLLNVPVHKSFGRLNTLLPGTTSGSTTYARFSVVLLLLLLPPLSPQGCS